MAEAVLARSPQTVAAGDALLQIKGLQAWYGESHILHGVDFDIRHGEVMTLLGRNGAGKTTTLKSIMGLIAKRSGSIAFQGRELIALAPEQIARQGIAFCPEERGIFASLTVRENLTLPPAVASGGLQLDEIFELFPNLEERLSSNQGTKLSGGEQQMLAIARALVSDPKVLLLDEPSQGLAPLVVRELARVIRLLCDAGVTILLIEQNMKLAEVVADELHIMVKGRIVYSADPQRFRAEEDQIRTRYLTV